MKSEVGYKNRTPRQFANDMLGVKSFERGDAWAHHMPVEVYVQVASACNLDCYMCYEHLRPKEFKRGRGLRVLGPELFAKLEREVLPYSTKITFGVGGEPMLCEHLLEYIERSHKLNQHVHLMTNGTRITTDKVAETLARCLSSMEVSIDAATKQTYERIRIGSKWETILANFERFNRFRDRYQGAERTHLSLCFVMMRSNVHELPGFVELGRRLGADRVAAWHVIPVTPAGREESLQYEKDKSDHYLRLAHQKARELGIEADLVKPFDARLEEELAPLIAQSRQGAIERKDAKEHDRAAAPAAQVVLDEKTPDQWMEDEHAWSRPLTGKHAADSNGGRALPSAALRVERKQTDDAVQGAHAPDEEEPWRGTTIVEGLTTAPGEVDPRTGVRMGAAWQPLADPPSPDDAARALAEFDARPKAKRLHCHMPSLTAFIFFDGRVFPCCHPHAHTKLPMGDLRVQSFREIWNGRAYRNLRAGLVLGDPPPLCQRCSIMQSPPPVFESEEELEGQAADLASYYGPLDLEPRAKHAEPQDLVSALDDAGLAQHLKIASAERAAFEAERAEMVAHIRTIEDEIRQQKAHIATLNAHHARLVPHAETLERETAAQKGHIAFLEAENADQRSHISNLEFLVRTAHARAIHAVKQKLYFWRN
jgi:MoaA/NifB/PqqE/SkfB family radical SAM enzyme